MARAPSLRTLGRGRNPLSDADAIRKATVHFKGRWGHTGLGITEGAVRSRVSSDATAPSIAPAAAETFEVKSCRAADPQDNSAHRRARSSVPEGRSLPRVRSRFWHRDAHGRRASGDSPIQTSLGMSVKVGDGVIGFPKLLSHRGSERIPSQSPIKAQA